MNIVFLDIDGVLQPYDSENRFYEINHKTKELVNLLSHKYQIDYTKYSIYDILSVYYDWDESAVNRLKYVLDQTTSKIIITSDWRSFKLPNKMHDLLTIRGLDNYWLCDNDIINDELSLVKKRVNEINKSLKKYEIDNYVVLDDMKGLKEYFPNNSVITYDYMNNIDMENCIKILKKKRG